MPDDEQSIFGNLPGLKSDDDEEARERRARTRLYMRMRAPEEGPLRPSGWSRGVGGPSINQTPVVTGSTWSAADASANSPPMTLSNGGITVTPSGVAGNETIRGTTNHSAGKWYVEFLNTAAASTFNQIFGLADSSFTAANLYLGSNGVSCGVQIAGAFYGTSGFAGNAPGSPITPAINDVWALAVDLTTGRGWLGQNNVWLGSGNPGTGASPYFTIAAPALGVALFPGMTFNGTGEGVWTLQPTAASQKYAPPSGFSPWG